MGKKAEGRGRKEIAMLRKPYKTITRPESTGEINIYGNNHYREVFYGIPEWHEDDEEPELEPYFRYKGQCIFLSEILRIENYAPQWMKDFDGYTSDSFFSGLLVKLNDDASMVKVYTFIS